MISQKESHIVTIQKMLAFLLSFPWPPWLPMAPLWQVSSSPPRTAWRGHEPLQAILFGRSKCQAVLRPPRFGWRFGDLGCNQCVPSGKHTKSYWKSPFLMGKLTSTAPINPLVSATSSYGASQRIWNMIGISWEYHRDMIGISYLEDIPRLVFFWWT